MTKTLKSRSRALRDLDILQVEAVLKAGVVKNVGTNDPGNLTTEYSVLQEVLGGVSPPVIWAVLSTSVTHAVARNSPILAALAVGRKGIPGKGFFTCLRNHGIDVEQGQEEEVWRTLVNRIRATPVRHL